MNFLDSMPEFFMGCDPDSRHMAYAIVDRQGNVTEAFTIDHQSNPLDQSNVHRYYRHRINDEFVAVVEGQKVYKDDKKSNPDSLITLARVSGIACYWLASSPACKDIVIASPQEWKGSKQKHAHQAHILTRLGQTPIVKGKGDHRYCIPEDDFLGLNMTQYKHVIDAIGLALWLRDAYSWEFKKRNKLNQL